MDRYVVYVEHEGAWHVWAESHELKEALDAIEELLNEYDNDCRLCVIDPDGVENPLMRRGFE